MNVRPKKETPKGTKLLCRHCERWLAKAKFYPIAGDDRWSSYCKLCAVVRNREWRQRNEMYFAFRVVKGGIVKPRFVYDRRKKVA